MRNGTLLSVVRLTENGIVHGKKFVFVDLLKLKKENKEKKSKKQKKITKNYNAPKFTKKWKRPCEISQRNFKTNYYENIRIKFKLLDLGMFIV